MFFRNLNSEALASRIWQRRSEWQKKRVSCLVATDAATSLTIANAYARIVARLLAATAAQATAEQRADKTVFFAHCYSVVKINGN
jgi:hypothetical protein